FVAFLTVVAMAAWIQGRWGGLADPRKNQVMAFGVAVAVSAVGGWYFLEIDPPPESDCATETAAFEDLDFSEDIPWQEFSEPAVASLAGQVVFIDFTADWCLTCKVNEKTVLNTKAVRGHMADNGVMPLKADWTNRNEVITKWLQRYGKAGVPFYLVIPADPGAEPIALPEVITPNTVIEALEKAKG
ncbi:MAG: thiol:disulfide interchange protein, partial [Cognaticolwellia sp.]